MKYKTVLVVEDNPLNMKLVKDLLQLGNYNVLEACNAKAGIKLSHEYNPDLILMDIQLPGMDGLTATRHIKHDSALKDIPVIALTAHAMIGDDKKAGEAGCDGYISKPIDTRKFLKQVEKFIEIKSNKIKSFPGEGVNHKNRILIIDDDPLNTKLLAAKLPALEYETKIISCLTGIEEAIIKEHPDAILMDAMMAEIDSYKLTGKIKNNPETRNVPIIIITPIDGKDSKSKALEAGVDEIINKPVNSIELLSRINSVISLKKYEEQLSIYRESEEFIHGHLDQKDPVNESMLSCSVLIIGDNEKDVKLIQNYLQDQLFRVSRVNDCNEAISLVQHEKIDLFIMDNILPVKVRVEAYRRLKSNEKARNIPVIAITSVQDLENMSEVIEKGVDDFLIKPISSQELRVRMTLSLKKKRYIEHLNKSCNEAFVNSAIYDGLTGRHSFMYFRHFLELEVKSSLTNNYPVSLTIMSIDDSKHHDDISVGQYGVELILALAQIIQSSVRETDMVTRFGENELAIILPYHDKNTTLSVVERICKVVSSHGFNNEETSRQGQVNLSIGIATCPYDAITSDELIQNAKNMLGKAQKEGKNRVCVYG